MFILINQMKIENNNIYHRTIKMKPIPVKDRIYINTSKEVNDENPKF